MNNDIIGIIITYYAKNLTELLTDNEKIKIPPVTLSGRFFDSFSWLKTKYFHVYSILTSI